MRSCRDRIEHLFLKHEKVRCETNDTRICYFRTGSSSRACGRNFYGYRLTKKLLLSMIAKAFFIPIRSYRALFLSVILWRVPRMLFKKDTK